MPSPAPLRGVIIDLDGTLADTLPVIFIAFRRALLEHSHRHFTDAEIEALFGPNEQGSFQQVLSDRWEPGYQTFLAAYEEAHALCRAPFPGIVELLEGLAEQGISVALVTGKGDPTTTISLKHLGLAARFESVETGSALGPIKPQAIRKVLTRWGFAPDEVAYVGDALTDITAAREAGVVPLAAAWARRTDATRLEAMSPAALFRSVQALSDWLENHIAPA